MNQDIYCYPGTNVLRNKEDIQDREQLRATERLLSSLRLNELPFRMAMTPAGYRDLHRQIFQDIYAWAGQDRTVDMKRTSLFARPHLIDINLNTCFRAINAENNLRGLDATTFAGRAAVHCGDLNTIHPFREGNGRTLRAFLERLGHQAGHVVDLERIEPALWNHASQISHERGDNGLLTTAIAGAIDMPAQERAQQIEEPEQDRGDELEL